jgi:hypothetical protein
VHLIHPPDVPAEPSEGGEFRTLLAPEVGGSLGVYLLTIIRSEPHVHEKEDQIYRHCLASLDGQPVTLYSLMHAGS